MTGTMTFVGLDVHARSTHACALDPLGGELRRRAFGPGVDAVVEWLHGLPQPVRACYEAGPTGFGLYRAAEAAGIAVQVVAPGKTPRPARDRVKNDRKDAELLCRLLLAGQLTPIAVPSAEVEAARDLGRAREQVRADLCRARHRVSKLLLRHGRVYPERSSWTVAHRRWLARQRFPHAATGLAYLDALAHVDGLVARRGALDEQLSRLALDGEWAATVARLRCFRGLDTLSALVLCLEIGDFHRFHRAAQLPAWLGLTPTRQQSGDSDVSGPITKTGSRHARRILVEAAWHCGRPPHIGVTLAHRHHGQPAHILHIAWRCQHRLHRLHRSLRLRHKPPNLITIALARELACFTWAAATAP